MASDGLNFKMIWGAFMKMAKNRQRILEVSIDLFNQNGVVAVTTNHIAQALDISPGNLYFHFRNKEEIIQELFDNMCEAVYKVWETQDSGKIPPPLELVENVFEVIWQYRFLYRESYHLRKKDSVLNKKWRSYVLKTMRLILANYKQWVKSDVMVPLKDPKEVQMISDLVLITSISLFQFFESPEQPASKKHLKLGTQHIARLLRPYHSEHMKPSLEKYILK